MSETQIHCSATKGSSLEAALLLFPSEEEAEGTGEGGSEEGGDETAPRDAEEEFLLVFVLFWCSIILIAPSKTLVMCEVLLETSREPLARERTE